MLDGIGQKTAAELNLSNLSTEPEPGPEPDPVLKQKQFWLSGFTETI